MDVQGGCLCGSIRYEYSGTPAAAVNCHCSLCRKAHGSAYGSFLIVPKDSFKWTKGESELARYQSSPEAERQFCPKCGSQLTVYEAWNPEGITIAMGSIEGDPGLDLECHIFAESKACWSEILDDLPQHETWPPGVGPSGS